MKRLFFLLVIFVTVSSACRGGLPALLELSDPSNPILVNSGEEFTIVLDSNPTTGYHWEIVGELDAGLEFILKDYINDAPVAVVGSGGVDVWTFKAVSAGEAHITLGYYPPSNELEDPQQTVTFTVTVK